MRELPAGAGKAGAPGQDDLHRHHGAAAAFAFVVILIHLGAMNWAELPVSPDEALAWLSTGVQTGLRVALAVALMALALVLHDHGLRYLGAAFACLVLGDGAAALMPAGSGMGAWPALLPQAVGTAVYVALVIAYARHGVRAVSPGVDLRIGAAAGALVLALGVAAMLPYMSGEGARVADPALIAQTALGTVIGALPIVALALVVHRRGDCLISVWLIALLAVQALAWSGRNAAGTWGGEIARLCNLAAELALFTAIVLSVLRQSRVQSQTNLDLHALAHTDALTGLYNRRYLDLEITRACQRARRHGTALAVVMADVDHFKRFNDRYGHLLGDECLRQVGAVFRARQQRVDDVACRYGGEEFAMLLPGCDLHSAHRVAEALCADVRALAIPHADSAAGRVTLSVGVAALWDLTDVTGADLLRQADAALYAAKLAGRDTVRDANEASVAHRCGDAVAGAMARGWRRPSGGATAVLLLGASLAHAPAGAAMNLDVHSPTDRAARDLPPDVLDALPPFRLLPLLAQADALRRELDASAAAGPATDAAPVPDGITWATAGEPVPSAAHEGEGVHAYVYGGIVFDDAVETFPLTLQPVPERSPAPAPVATSVGADAPADVADHPVLDAFVAEAPIVDTPTAPRPPEPPVQLAETPAQASTEAPATVAPDAPADIVADASSPVAAQAPSSVVGDVPATIAAAAPLQLAQAAPSPGDAPLFPRDAEAPRGDAPAWPPADATPTPAANQAPPPAPTPAMPPDGVPLLLTDKPDTGYDALVARARAGEPGPALDYLRHVDTRDGIPVRYIADHVAIAGWAGEDDEAITVYENYRHLPELPAYVHTAAGHAYRNEERWAEALTAYERALALDAGDGDAQAGRINTLTDLGRIEDAVQRGAAWVASHPDDVQARLAYGEALTRAGRPHAALYEIDQALRRAPDDIGGRRAHLWALHRVGLAEAALALAQADPGLVDANELRDLQAEHAAELVRVSQLTPPTEGERFAAADKAIAYADGLIAAWSALSPPPRDDLTRVRIDRLGALLARDRARELIAAYEGLRQEGITVPLYGQRWAASAYLYERRPQEARAILENLVRVTAGTDADTDDEVLLYFATSESGDPAAAQARIAQAVAREPVYRRVRGVPGPLANDPWLDLALIDAQAPVQEENPDSAETRLRDLIDGAPENQALRTALASVYLARGEPRRAERALKLAEGQDPRGLELEVEQGFAALELQEWRQAELLTADVTARAPERADVRQLARAYDIHNRWELRMEATRSLPDTASPVSGSGEHDFSTLLYSPPLMQDWRVFLGWREAHAHFAEGDARLKQARLGLQYRVRDVTLEGEVSANDFRHGTDMGLRLAAAYDFDDHWQAGVQLERLSADTPLRALRADDTADAVTVFGQWRSGTRSVWKLGFTPMHFDDGNDRYSLNLLGTHRLYASPRFYADLGLSVDASTNSRQNVPYYSPRADLTVLPSLDLSQALHRRYETSWRHHLLLGAGTYTQRGFGTGGIVQVGYGHRWRNDVFDVGATVSWISRPYDGQREHEKRAVIDLVYRF